MISLKHTMFKFALLLPMVLLLSCSKAGVDQTDPKAVAELHLSSLHAHKYEAAYALLEPNKQVSLQEFTEGHKKLSEFVGENPGKSPDDTSMEVHIEDDKATVKARSTFKQSNGSQSERTDTVRLVQIEGKWWVSLAEEKAEERSYQCVGKSGEGYLEYYFSEQPCPTEYTAQKVGIPDNLKNYCIAVFKRDYSYVDKSGWKIDVKKGEELLLSSKSSKEDSFMPTNFAYLTDQGAVIFPNNEEKDDSKLFSSNCDSKQTRLVYAAFSDLTLYSDAALETQACQLKTGKIIDMPHSFDGLPTGGFTIGSPTESFTLDSLAPLCNGHKTVYIDVALWVKKTDLGGAYSLWLLLAPQ